MENRRQQDTAFPLVRYRQPIQELHEIHVYGGILLLIENVPTNVFTRLCAYRAYGAFFIWARLCCAYDAQETFHGTSLHQTQNIYIKRKTSHTPKFHGTSLHQTQNIYIKRKTSHTPKF
ncbi:MAG: hypothetical protein IJ268_01405, partial [Proteobacteria bacterium]|nr:hypothetical protein [Pseudomonadota bacterium]